MRSSKRRREWGSDEPFSRRYELYRRAAPIFHKNGYRGTTLKALATACGLSIPGLYRYFPSKKAFALFPLRSLYPELHGPPPDVAVGDPVALLSDWVEAGAAEMPMYILAARLLREVPLRPDEQRKVDTNLAEHVDILTDLARRAAPQLEERTARELASTMINVVMGPALTGVEPEPDGLRRQLRALFRGHGIALPRARGRS